LPRCCQSRLFPINSSRPHLPLYLIPCLGLNLARVLRAATAIASLQSVCAFLPNLPRPHLPESHCLSWLSLAWVGSSCRRDCRAAAGPAVSRVCCPGLTCARVSLRVLVSNSLELARAATATASLQSVFRQLPRPHAFESQSTPLLASTSFDLARAATAIASLQLVSGFSLSSPRPHAFGSHCMSHSFWRPQPRLSWLVLPPQMSRCWRSQLSCRGCPGLTCPSLKECFGFRLA
jgi:hypothetical protein